MPTIFQVVTSESSKGPFVLFMKDVEKSIAGNTESYAAFKSKFETLPDNAVVVGSHTQLDTRKEKVPVSFSTAFSACDVLITLQSLVYFLFILYNSHILEASFSPSLGIIKLHC